MQETPRKGADTRERILDVAEASVLDKGFAATSIEEVIAAVGITKSGFFYHFRDKNELAKALLVRRQCRCYQTYCPLLAQSGHAAESKSLG